MSRKRNNRAWKPSQPLKATPELRKRIQDAVKQHKAVLRRLEDSELGDFRPWVQQYPDDAAVYLYVARPKFRLLETREVAPGVSLDYDTRTGELVGIEVLFPFGRGADAAVRPEEPDGPVPEGAPDPPVQVHGD